MRSNRKLSALLLVLLLACGGCADLTGTLDSPPTGDPSGDPPPTSVVTPSPSPAAPSGVRVRTDWSALTPYAPDGPLYTRRYPGFTDTLIPAGDYGPLVAFLGDRLGGESYYGLRYGLMTLQGEIVADPVFSNVWLGDNGGGAHNAKPLPYMMLSKGVSSASPDEWPDVGGGWAMAALDGSWCTEFKYQLDNELEIWGRDINANADERGLFVLSGEALVYLDGATGEELMRLTEAPVGSIYDYLFSAYRTEDGAIFSTYSEKSHYYHLNWETDALTEITWEAYKSLYPVYREDDQPSASWNRRPLNNISRSDGWKWCRDGERLIFVRGDEVCSISTPYDPQDVMWGRVVPLQNDDGDGIVMTLDGETLPVSGVAFWNGIAHVYDSVTGEGYVRLRNGGRFDFYNEAGTLLCSLPAGASAFAKPVGGLIYIQESDHTALRTTGGDWVFRYPLPAGEWD